MTRWIRSLSPIAFAMACLWTAPARAGEADDLQRMIDAARRNAEDLERLDDLKAVREDVTLLRVWLDEAWRFRSQEKYDEVRGVMDRISAQQDMIRERIKAAQLSATAAKKEAAVQRVREKIAEAQKQIEAAKLQKAALGAKATS